MTVKPKKDYEPSPDGKGSVISVRLDAPYDNALSDLLLHYNETDQLKRETTVSDVIRYAIGSLHNEMIRIEKLNAAIEDEKA